MPSAFARTTTCCTATAFDPDSFCRTRAWSPLNDVVRTASAAVTVANSITLASSAAAPLPSSQRALSETLRRERRECVRDARRHPPRRPDKRYLTARVHARHARLGDRAGGELGLDGRAGDEGDPEARLH